MDKDIRNSPNNCINNLTINKLSTLTDINDKNSNDNINSNISKFALNNKESASKNFINNLDIKYSTNNNFKPNYLMKDNEIVLSDKNNKNNNDLISSNKNASTHSINKNCNYESKLIIKEVSNDQLIEVNGYYKNTLINSNCLGLSYYEVVAGPRIIKDISQLDLSNEQIQMCIKDVFKCSICLSIYTDPVNIKNCLHKFCKKCIEDYTRKEKKECVICRTQIETRRHMSEDRNMSSIISCFISNIKKYNDNEELEAINIINKTITISESNITKNNNNNFTEVSNLSNNLTESKLDKNNISNNINSKTNNNKLLKRKRPLQLNNISNIDEIKDNNTLNIKNKKSKNSNLNLLNKSDTVTLLLYNEDKKYNNFFESRIKITLDSQVDLNLIENYIKFKINSTSELDVKFYLDNNSGFLSKNDKLIDIINKWNNISLDKYLNNDDNLINFKYCEIYNKNLKKTKNCNTEENSDIVFDKNIVKLCFKLA